MILVAEFYLAEVGLAEFLRLWSKYCFLTRCLSIPDVAVANTVGTKNSHNTTLTPLLPHNRVNLLGATTIKQPQNYLCTTRLTVRDSMGGKENPVDSNSSPTHNGHYRTAEETTTTATQNSEWILSTTPSTQLNYKQSTIAEVATQQNMRVVHSTANSNPARDNNTKHNRSVRCEVHGGRKKDLQ